MSAAHSSGASGSTWTSTRSIAGSAPSYDELFGFAPPQPPKAMPSLDNTFDSFKDPAASTALPPPKPKHSSMPVFDKPVYDNDILSLDSDDTRMGLMADGAMDALSIVVSRH
ncbi:unnamed protein product [Miscanthus lutarioriparius]|uniref:Uncharacterized protein n=1 Tax=Miscanthus lutarioriparius TaxID=422564 RepID=A0A811QMT8_9POAL|nr:unnamed protein product [Miscanthus lutarioriparius]